MKNLFGYLGPEKDEPWDTPDPVIDWDNLSPEEFAAQYYYWKYFVEDPPNDEFELFLHGSRICLAVTNIVRRPSCDTNSIADGFTGQVVAKASHFSCDFAGSGRFDEWLEDGATVEFVRADRSEIEGHCWNDEDGRRHWSFVVKAEPAFFELIDNLVRLNAQHAGSSSAVLEVGSNFLEPLPTEVSPSLLDFVGPVGVVLIKATPGRKV